jgi:hypothetical protein
LYGTASRRFSSENLPNEKFDCLVQLDVLLDLPGRESRQVPDELVVLLALNRHSVLLVVARWRRAMVSLVDAPNSASVAKRVRGPPGLVDGRRSRGARAGGILGPQGGRF